MPLPLQDKAPVMLRRELVSDARKLKHHRFPCTLPVPSVALVVFFSFNDGSFCKFGVCKVQLWANHGSKQDASVLPQDLNPGAIPTPWSTWLCRYPSPKTVLVRDRQRVDSVHVLLGVSMVPPSQRHERSFPMTSLCI